MFLSVPKQVLGENMEIVYEVIVTHLQDKNYPEGARNNTKRAIKNKSKKFVIDGGVLFYAAGGTLKQWINSKERQHEIVKSGHADKLGGHFGRDKTREKVTSRFVIYN